MKKRLRSNLILCLFGCLAIQTVSGQNSIIPGSIRVDSTFMHIGVLWEVKGDANLNSRLTIEYRSSPSEDWKSGAFPMRAHPEIEVSGERLGLNYWAGSALFLEPGVEYEMRLILGDPDGGGTTRIIKAATKKEQQPSASGTHHYVEPGMGGGSGTADDPFKGLEEAARHAKPGAIFHVSPGKYRPFAVKVGGEEGSPIAFVGPEDKSAVIDGSDTSEGIVTLGDYEGTYGYLIVENFTIQNGRWGVDAQNTHHITFRNNLVRDVDWGYINRRENGLEHEQTISDNTFMGRTEWPGTEVPDERGINLIGNNNIVCYNSISYFGDGISTDSYPYGVSFSLDIYHNDISYCVDDLVEVDGTVSNTRIWRNRLYNGRMGVSVAPIMGGPCYIFRNEIFNTEDMDGSYSAFKMNRSPTGLVVVHNTVAKMGRGITGPSGWQNTLFRNNLFFATEYIFELYDLVTESMMDDWDFDAFASERSGTADEPWFKWDDVRYADLGALQEGAEIELHGVQIKRRDLSEADLPAIYEEGVSPGSRDLTLTPGCAAIDRGEALANINDPFVRDGLPDCGAFEFGEPEPLYGPRQ